MVMLDREVKGPSLGDVSFESLGRIGCLNKRVYRGCRGERVRVLVAIWLGKSWERGFRKLVYE